MNLMGLFRSPQNELEKGGKQLKNPQEEQHEITMTCPKCGTQTPVSELWDDLNVCRWPPFPHDGTPAHQLFGGRRYVYGARCRHDEP